MWVIQASSFTFLQLKVNNKILKFIFFFFSRASAALTRAGVRCSNQFGRIYDHRRPRFGIGGGSDQDTSNRTSSSSTGSPPPSPSSPLATSVHTRRNLENLDSGYTTPSNMTNASVTTQDTSVSTPSSSPSPTSTGTSRDDLPEMGPPRSDLMLTKSVNLLANVPPKSETVKTSRPLIVATNSLPLQPEMSSQSMYATLGVRHPNQQPAYIHPNFGNGLTTTIPRRASPNATSTERRPPRVSLVTASTSNNGNEGTLQKVKRVYL